MTRLLTSLSDDDFAKDIDKYLTDLETSPVRSLSELIEFNQRNADSELPSSEYKYTEVNGNPLIRVEAPNQDHLTEAHAQNTSSEDYQRHLAHFRDVTKNKALDHAFFEHNVNIIVAPADSVFTCLASGSGMPVRALYDRD